MVTEGKIGAYISAASDARTTPNRRPFMNVFLWLRSFPNTWWASICSYVGFPIRGGRRYGKAKWAAGNSRLPKSQGAGQGMPKSRRVRAGMSGFWTEQAI